MRQFYALTVIAVLFQLQSSAQFTQNFDAANALTSGCNLTVNSDRTTTSGEVINGAGSLYSNPPVNGSSTRDYFTPFLNVIDPVIPSAPTTTFSVSFNYKLNETLNGQAERTIQVGLDGASGFLSLATITMDKNYTPVTAVSFSQSFTVPKGVYRLVLKMGGNQGNGSVRIIIDDLVSSANALYSAGGTCNSAPVIRNDVYSTTNATSATYFASVLANDTDPDGETFATPVLTTPSPDGTVVFNSDGSFTFTPNFGFTGPSTSFSYTTNDKGYAPLTGTAVVTIFFQTASPLPVKLINFSGNLVNNKAVLNWTVANNEDGEIIEIEKSTDGRNFVTEAVVLITEKQGTEKYAYKSAGELTATSFYRLKIINKDGTVLYSGVVKLSAGNPSSAAAIQVMQNPVKNSLSFSYTAQANTTSIISLYEISGKKTVGQQMNLQKGVNLVTVEVSRLIAGTYVLEVVSGADRQVTKIIKQ